jgi:uncharacterized Zn finger protein
MDNRGMDKEQHVIKCVKCGDQMITAYRKKDGRPYLRCKGCGRVGAHPTLFTLKTLKGEWKL